MSDAYACPVCTAACTFEAMNWCALPVESCPVIQALADGSVVDRRPTDRDPSFPTEFSIAPPAPIAIHHGGRVGSE